jgi:transposase
MFFPESRVRVFLYGQPTDMRKSYDGLYALARQGFQADPLAGHLFVFANRRGTQIKILYFDRSGWALWAKRLEAGKFVRNWSDTRGGEIDCTALKLMLEGIEVKRQYKRYSMDRGSA